MEAPVTPPRRVEDVSIQTLQDFLQGLEKSLSHEEMPRRWSETWKLIQRFSEKSTVEEEFIQVQKHVRMALEAQPHNRSVIVSCVNFLKQYIYDPHKPKVC